MQVLKETDNVIIYKSDKGITHFKIKVKDESDIIEGVK